VRLATGVVLAAALALAACSRDKGPYKDWKAPQLMEEGERLLRANEIDAADKVFRLGRERAEKAGYPAEKLRVFDLRRLYIAAAREDAVEAENLFSRVGGLNNPEAMDIRMATNLAVLLQRAGQPDKARALAEKMALRLNSHEPELDEMPFHLVGWIVLDRVRTANVEIVRARQASDAFVATLAALAERAITSQQPLPNGLRPWITRYVDHLYDSGRTLVAQKAADLVSRIDEVAAPDESAGCMKLDPQYPALGCLADWPAK
jgi:hypothetical protein